MKQIFILGFFIFYLSACNNKPNADADWIKGYATYINDNVDTSIYKKYSVCYIDDDDVPEVCLFGSCFSDGTVILSQYNGTVIRRDCNISPYYIERCGLVDDGVSHTGFYVEQILRLRNGVFEEILCAEATWHEEDSEFPAYFVYKINDHVIDTLYGEDINEGSCAQMNDAIKQAYSAKGTSRAMNESSQRLFDISEMFKQTK